MTDLAAGTVDTVDHLAVNDDAAANTGAQSHEHNVLTATAAAHPAFTQSGHGGIVAGNHPEAGEAAQGLMDVEHAPTQVDALVHHAVVIHRTRHTDADAQNILVGDLVFVQVLHNGGGDVRQDQLAAVCGDRGDLPLVKHGAVFFKVSDLDGGAAQIHTKAVFHICNLQLHSVLVFLSSIIAPQTGKSHSQAQKN